MQENLTGLFDESHVLKQKHRKAPAAFGNNEKNQTYRTELAQGGAALRKLEGQQGIVPNAGQNQAEGAPWGSSAAPAATSPEHRSAPRRLDNADVDRTMMAAQERALGAQQGNYDVADAFDAAFKDISKTPTKAATPAVANGKIEDDDFDF
jgi:hypothetical protein